MEMREWLAEAGVKRYFFDSLRLSITWLKSHCQWENANHFVKKKALLMKVGD